MGYLGDGIGNMYDWIIGLGIQILDVIVKSTLGLIPLAGFPFPWDHQVLEWAHAGIAVIYPIMSVFNVLPLVMAIMFAFSLWSIRKVIALALMLGDLVEMIPVIGKLLG